MKKSSSYRETFRQHRVLLSLPIIIATLIGGWFVIGAPKSYQSTVSLWVDNSAPASSSLEDANPSLTPPSQQEQSILTELLATSGFDFAVAHHSQLAPYLASHPSNGFGPSELLSMLSGKGSVDTEIISDLSAKHVITSVPGPQVLQISYLGPTPAVAQSTLKAMVQELQQDTDQFLQEHNVAAHAYYKAQAQSALQAVAAARAQESTYLREHPGTAPGNPTLTALQTAVAAANSQLTQANSNLNAVGSAGGGGGGDGAQVIDPPTYPPGPTSGKKKELEGVVGGLVAGILISLLGTIALTRGKPDPWEAELDESRAAASGDSTAVTGEAAVAGSAVSSDSDAAPVGSLVPTTDVNPAETPQWSGPAFSLGGPRRVRESTPTSPST